MQILVILLLLVDFQNVSPTKLKKGGLKLDINNAASFIQSIKGFQVKSEAEYPNSIYTRLRDIFISSFKVCILKEFSQLIDHDTKYHSCLNRINKELKEFSSLSEFTDWLFTFPNFSSTKIYTDSILLKKIPQVSFLESIIETRKAKTASLSKEEFRSIPISSVNAILKEYQSDDENFIFAGNVVPLIRSIFESKPGDETLLRILNTYGSIQTGIKNDTPEEKFGFTLFLIERKFQEMDYQEEENTCTNINNYRVQYTLEESKRDVYTSLEFIFDFFEVNYKGIEVCKEFKREANTYLYQVRVEDKLEKLISAYIYRKSKGSTKKIETQRQKREKPKRK